MQQTSRESFRKLKNSDTQKQRQTILDFLQKWSFLNYSDREISRATGLAINIVESRRNDLDKKYGQIEYAGEIYDKQTKRWVRTWRARK